MSNVVYPVLPGLGYSVLKTPGWNTIQQRAASGRETRVALMSSPIWAMTLTYAILRDGIRNGTTYNELRKIMDFFNARTGDFDNFLFDDPDDDTVTDQNFGTGDGVTASFQLSRQLFAGGYAEPVMNINTMTNVKDAGSIITAGAGAGKYTISASGLVTFGTVPTAGHALTWSGTYYFRCRFQEPTLEFEKFMYQLWQLKTAKLFGSLGLKI